MNRLNGRTVMVALALIALVPGCADPMRPGEAPRLAGAWRGYFRQVGAGDTGYVHGDIDLQIAADGTYAGTWTTRQVAGSTRAGSTRMTGTAVVNGRYVTLTDWRHLILKRTGDTLFGFTIDPEPGRTLSVHLDRVP